MNKCVHIIKYVGYLFCCRLIYIVKKLSENETIVVFIELNLIMSLFKFKYNDNVRTIWHPLTLNFIQVVIFL